MIHRHLNQSNKVLTATATLGTIVVLALVFKIGGPVLVIALCALAIGALVHHAIGESERIRERVRIHTSELKDMAYRDSLTGLPNRRFFISYLEHNLAMCMANRRNDSHVNRVVLFDLNGFKSVNDTYGHEAGDELLKFIAVTVSAYLPSDTLLARLGGDEFVVLVRDTTDGRRTREVEKTIRTAASSTFMFNKQDITVSASVGVSAPATKRSTAKQLLHDSDQRMYLDKVVQRGSASAESGETPAAPDDTVTLVGPTTPVILRARHTVRSVNERRKVRAHRSKLTAVTLGQASDSTTRPS